MEHDLEWYRKEVSKRFIIKLRGYLGPNAHHKMEIRILNGACIWKFRYRQRIEEMVTSEAGQWHANISYATTVWNQAGEKGGRYLGTSQQIEWMAVGTPPPEP